MKTLFLDTTPVPLFFCSMHLVLATYLLEFIDERFDYRG